MKKLAVDTNILARLLVRDDSAQWEIARALFETNRVVLMLSVLLETEWVLRSRFDYKRETICRLFESLSRTEAVDLHEPDRTPRVIAAYEAGMDFADAVHVSGVRAGESFATLDRGLVRRAGSHFKTVSVELVS
ncbi:MAG: type II toxin-antitoxin system VapC family toxin [Hoeflea sp.]|uniref:type II toxin-antitoxin system VapC family toxin n=1 Tax=Hoeflea sp. TaxID=1940281 RepID=UPI001DFC0D6C|nr:type II toxin-antitoxin system VapC family toxin [Hoeflea sp.]MBU4527949.1 type II toxin-antitoxin system VapC family toxin [Alphaproteobacteria bacterium]MBU4546016.1 type II toxin-antitoxin system VapC family toxin [Alphaproteobacteria bacterium]MBU4553299.1 type II toxin-antitoxin system VapC family toxin [Alphaproteobacteria bacterium]MBV1724373.1 type II toxin-antitoxin system VapC family toxin [Hoeflea sp.]MBV1763369.1 type II toxin-antitoxin system VapC family toxin [Hoeflea sp.]